MKLKSFILAALFLVSFTTMQAQGKRGANGKDRADRVTTQMTEQLSLSDAQAAKIKEVNAKYVGKMQTLRANMEDRTQLRPEMQKLREAQDAEIVTFLTKEQAEMWTKIKMEREGRREKSRINRGKNQSAKGKRPTSPAKKPNSMGKKGKGDYTQKVQKRTATIKENLNLSDEQAKQVEAVYMEYGAKKQAAYKANTEEARATVKELRMEENKAVDAILTKEQLAKYEELKTQSREKKSMKKQKMQRAKAIEQN